MTKKVMEGVGREVPAVMPQTPQKPHCQVLDEMVDAVWRTITSYSERGVSFCEAVGIVEMIKVDLMIAAVEEGKGVDPG